MTGVEEAARVLCDSDDSMEHHDQTDDHPCSRCVRYADALDRNGLLAQPTVDEAEGDEREAVSRLVLDLQGELAGLRERVEAVLADACHHCGRLPDVDGDHTCVCPNADSECLFHQEHPVAPLLPIRAALEAATSCTCGSDATSLNPAEVVVHRAEGPCYIATPPAPERNGEAS